MGKIVTIVGTQASGKSTIAFDEAVKHVEGDLSKIAYVPLGNQRALPDDFPADNIFEVWDLEDIDTLSRSTSGYKVIVIDDIHIVVDLVIDARDIDIDDDVDQRTWGAVKRGVTRILKLSKDAEATFVTALVRPDTKNPAVYRQHLNSDSAITLSTRSTALWFTYRNPDYFIEKDPSRAYRLEIQVPEPKMIGK